MSKYYLIANLLLLFSLSGHSQTTIDLSGTWRFAIDREEKGETEQWYFKTLNDQIELPGSAARQLLYNLKKYMLSNSFNPSTTLQIETISLLTSNPFKPIKKQ